MNANVLSPSIKYASDMLSSSPSWWLPSYFLPLILAFSSLDSSKIIPKSPEIEHRAFLAN